MFDKDFLQLTYKEKILKQNMNSLFELCYAYHMIGFCFFFIRHFSVQIAIFPFICAIQANNPSCFIYATLLKMEMS